MRTYHTHCSFCKYPVRLNNRGSAWRLCNSCGREFDGGFVINVNKKIKKKKIQKKSVIFRW